ncbi:MAG: YtxH domain-containing protein [Chloroflexota bacterium]
MNNNRIYYSREAEERAARERATLIILFLLCGLGVGTIMALLFAPTPGAKTREELARAVEEGLTSGRDTVEPTLKRLEKEFADLRKNVEDRFSEKR